MMPGWVRGFVLGSGFGGLVGGFVLAVLGHVGAGSVFMVIAIIAAAAHRELRLAEHKSAGGDDQ